MRLACNCLTLAILLGLILSPAVVRAQPGTAPLSDYLQLTITDQTGVDVIPPMFFPIDEPPVAPDPGEQPIQITIPGVTIDFMEGPVGAQDISDRFQIGPLVVNVWSEDLLPSRPEAKLIPGSALERFSPLSIVAFSDGENTAGTGVSDTLRISQGGYSGTPGEVVYDEVIEEPASETMPETLDFFVPPASFDVEEPLFETGGEPGIISDYVDLGDVQGFFVSSDDSGIYLTVPDSYIQGILMEDPEFGGTMIYTLSFVSDVVPEPCSLILLALGLVGVYSCRRGRRV
jgi:hypothetical protein